MSSEEVERAKPKAGMRYTPAERLVLLQCACGIFFFFVQYGKMQEAVFKFRSAKGKRFDAVWFLQFVEAVVNTFVSGIGRALQGSTADLPQSLLATNGFLQVLSKYSFSASLASGLSFHVATLAKSAKMVPVMLGSLYFGGQTFSRREVAQAASIITGTSLVALAEGSGKGGTSTVHGLALVGLALSCDGVIGGLQRRLKARFASKGKRVGPYDLMFWTNLYMAAAALVFAQVVGDMRKGLRFCRENRVVLWQILKMSLCGSMGQVVVFSTIARFDSVVCTAITTTRKLISVLVSLAEGDKPSLGLTGTLGLTVAAPGILGEGL